MAITTTWTAGDVLTAADLTDTMADKNNNKNLIHNGAMQVAQRGSSTASITTFGYYTADRWYAALVTLGTWTQSVENDAPTGSGFRKSLKMLCTTADAAPAAGDVLVMQQYIEGQDLQRIAKGTSSAQQLTISFWVKSNVTGTYIVELSDVDNTRAVSASYTVSASATWERKTVTFPADTTGAFNNDNATSLEVNFWLAAGSTYTSGTLSTSWAAATSANRVVGQTNVAASTNNYWQITGVQLETGSTATSYEFRSYADELQTCQRYYWRRTQPAATDNYYANVIAMSGTTWRGILHLPTPMRIPPTIEVSNVTHFQVFDTVVNPATATFESNTSNQLGLSTVPINGTVASGLTAARPGWIIGVSASAYLGFTADL